jgi:hypothetical protein
MDGHEFLAQRDEDLIAEQGMQNGVGIVERLDQSDSIGIAINGQSGRGRQGRRIHDGSGNRAGLAQQMALQIAL